MKQMQALIDCVPGLLVLELLNKVALRRVIGYCTCSLTNVRYLLHQRFRLVTSSWTADAMHAAFVTIPVCRGLCSMVSSLDHDVASNACLLTPDIR